MENTVLDNLKLCACGCGQKISRRAKAYRQGHYPTGKEGYHKSRNKGASHGRWKGRGISAKGYVTISGQYNHPRQSSGRVFEHILVFEEYHKCCILIWGAIHHINHNKQDNRIENLEGMMTGEHTRFHHLKQRFSDAPIS